jgi:hypothetical protein
VVVEPDAILVAAPWGILEHRKKAGGARNGQGHGAEFAKQLLPLGKGHAFAGRAKCIKERIETGEPMGRELEGFRDSVNGPAQQKFAMRPGGIAL